MWMLPEAAMGSKSPVVISYLRFNSPEQRHGDSTRRQPEMSRQWAESRGLTIDENLHDTGISAFRGAHSKSGALASNTVPRLIVICFLRSATFHRKSHQRGGVRHHCQFDRRNEICAFVGFGEEIFSAGRGGLAARGFLHLG